MSDQATKLMLWGFVVHFVVDWMLQNDWMAQNKASLRREFTRVGSHPWWDRHPAAYVHSGLHTLGLLLVFPPLAALALGASHLLIDTRVPVVWWSTLIRQTQPTGDRAVTWDDPRPFVVVDIGTEVRFWTDQAFHVAALAIAALAVG